MRTERKGPSASFLPILREALALALKTTQTQPPPQPTPPKDATTAPSRNPNSKPLPESTLSLLRNLGTDLGVQDADNYARALWRAAAVAGGVRSVDWGRVSLAVLFSDRSGLLLDEDKGLEGIPWLRGGVPWLRGGVEGEAEAGEPHPARELHLLEWVAEQEDYGVCMGIRGGGLTVGYVAHYWMSQTFWGYLPWPEVVLFAVLPFVFGPSYRIYYVVCVLKHLRTHIIENSAHTTTRLDLCEVLLNLEITQFRMKDHLDEMERMDKVYGWRVGFTNSK